MNQKPPKAYASTTAQAASAALPGAAPVGRVLVDTQTTALASDMHLRGFAALEVRVDALNAQMLDVRRDARDGRAEIRALLDQMATKLTKFDAVYPHLASRADLVAELEPIRDKIANLPTKRDTFVNIGVWATIFAGLISALTFCSKSGG